MLGLLTQIGPVNGNGLSQRAEVLIGDYWTLTRSQVYRELQALEHRGYLHAGPLGPRSSRQFTVTDAGHRAFRQWLDAGPAAEVIRFPMLLTIRFARDLEPARLRQLLEEFRALHHAKLEYYTQLEADMVAAANDPFEVATVHFGRLFESAVATWLADLPSFVPAVLVDRDTSTS